jgi:hypothetical protein
LEKNKIGGDAGEEKIKGREGREGETGKERQMHVLYIHAWCEVEEHCVYMHTSCEMEGERESWKKESGVVGWGGGEDRTKEHV